MSSSNNPPLDENEDGNEVQGGDSNESQSADTQGNDNVPTTNNNNARNDHIELGHSAGSGGNNDNETEPGNPDDGNNGNENNAGVDIENVRNEGNPAGNIEHAATAAAAIAGTHDDNDDIADDIEDVEDVKDVENIEGADNGPEAIQPLPNLNNLGNGRNVYKDSNAPDNSNENNRANNIQSGRLGDLGAELSAATAATAAGEGGGACSSMATAQDADLEAQNDPSQSLERERFGRWYTWLAYYVPLLEWLPKYRWKYVPKDLIAGLTLATISVPMSLSYAANLAKIQPINGLFATIAAPLVYAIFGKTRRLAVLPEAALSLIVGEAIRQNLGEKKNGLSHEEFVVLASQLCCMITFLAASITLVAGMLRGGFVDIIGSPPLLRGFISGVAIVILVEQLIPELGLEALAEDKGAAHASAFYKAKFVLTHLNKTHLFTFYIALVTFVTLVVAKSLKQYTQKRFRNQKISLIPDIFLIVMSSALLAKWDKWDEKGVTVLGHVEKGSFSIQWPISQAIWNDSDIKFSSVLSSSLVVAILGYFETMVGVKHLATKDNEAPKPNRELVALGMVNAFIPGLPVYGGLARSKINEYSGSKTLMSNVSLAFFTYLAIKYLLGLLAFLPKASLSAVISTVCLGLLFEAPPDLLYYWSMRAWMELSMICAVILCTISWSIDVGIYIGIGFSLMLLVRAAGNHSMKALKYNKTTHTWAVNVNDSDPNHEVVYPKVRLRC